MRGYESYDVEVPGTFDADVAFLDLETAKVPCDYRMSNGELLRKRWAIVMAGLALDGGISVMTPTAPDDDLFLGDLGARLTGNVGVVYQATRQFDEMICRGRFTTARRAHAPSAFFPAVPGADFLPWKNLGYVGSPEDAEREADCDSRDVPALLGFDPVGGGKRKLPNADLVMIHLLRDVVELILAAGNPDPICRAWCVGVLTSRSAAWDALFGPEETD